MRRTTLTLIAVLMLSPVLLANNKRDWANVEHLKPGTFVLVEYWNGSRVGGQIEMADDSGLVLVGHYPSSHPGLDDKIDRGVIWRVRRILGRQDLPDPAKYMFAGAVLGVVGGAVSAGVDTRKAAGATAGGVIGGIGGMAAGAVACAAVTLVKGQIILGRGPRLVYENAGPRPTSALAP